MYCYKCGKEVADDSRFCPGCGTELIKGPKTNNKAIGSNIKKFLTANYKKIAILLAIVVAIGCVTMLVNTIKDKKTVLDVVKYSDDGEMVKNAEEYLEKKNLSYRYGSPDLYNTEPDKFLGFNAYYDWDVDDYRIFVTFDTKKEFNKAKKKIEKYLEKRVDSDFAKSEFAGYINEDANRYWHAFISHYDGEDVYCTDYYEEDGMFHLEATTMQVASGLSKLDPQNGDVFVDAEYDRFIVIELYQGAYKLGKDFSSMDNDGNWAAEETAPAEDIYAETEAATEPAEEVAPAEATDVEEDYDEYADIDLKEYMRDNFYYAYPYIESRLAERGYEVKHLQCKLIWSSFDKSPKLIYKNEKGGIDIYEFSWQDVDCWDYYYDGDFSAIYDVDDLEYNSVDEAYEGYVNDIDYSVLNLYDLWYMAQPAYEREFTNLGYDSNNIKCRYIGETMEGAYTIIFVNQSGYLDSLMWFLEDGRVVQNDRTDDWDYITNDCTYNSIQDAFDGFVRAYW